MRTVLFILFLSTVGGWFLVSCSGQEDKEIRALLTQWDELLEKNPEAISDSLQTIRHEFSSKSG